MHEYIKKWIPPAMRDLKNRFFSLEKVLYYYDSYPSWNEAQKAADSCGGGYERPEILKKVIAATNSVRQNKAAYEQDGVAFLEKKINYELLCSLYYVHLKESRLHVADFGGSLGSIFFRIREETRGLDLDWSVIEQKHFTEYGRRCIPEISFYDTLDECLEQKDCSVLLLSSVLGYLPDPYDMLREFLEKKIRYIVIDETAFWKGKEQYMLQHVPESIYQAVYPVYLFELKRFRHFIRKMKYRIIFEWDYDGSIPVKRRAGFQETADKGFLLEACNERGKQ